MNKCRVVHHDESLRYLVATADIMKEEDVLAIPYAEWMSLENITSESPELNKLKEKGELVKQLSHPWRNSMYAIFLAEHLKRNDSPFRDYLNSLPQSQKHYPELFTEDELKHLKGSELMLQRIKKRNELVKKDYDLISQAVPSIKDTISFQEFQTGKILASSRAYDLAFTDGTTRQVIIPFIELSLINYGEKKNVNCLQIDGQLKLRACRDIKRGELIIQQQANACNSSIFLNSGFLAENNHEKNSVLVECSLDQADPNFKAKLELISQSDPAQKFLLRENLTIRDTYELISWLRYVVYDEEQAYLILAKT